MAKLTPGMMAYTSLCTEDGGIFDDLVVFCVGENQYLLTMAAFNTHKTPAWVEKHTAGMDICIADHVGRHHLHRNSGAEVAADNAEDRGFDVSNKALPYYRFVNGKIAGIDCMVARLGCTGELGYEIFYDPGHAWRMYDAFVKAGEDEGLALAAIARSERSGSRKSITSIPATSTRRSIPTRRASAGR